MYHVQNIVYANKRSKYIVYRIRKSIGQAYVEEISIQRRSVSNIASRSASYTKLVIFFAGNFNIPSHVIRRTRPDRLVFLPWQRNIGIYYCHDSCVILLSRNERSAIPTESTSIWKWNQFYSRCPLGNDIDSIVGRRLRDSRSITISNRNWYHFAANVTRLLK